MRPAFRALTAVGTVLLGVGLAACAQTQPSAPDWRLADADEVARPDYLILTVPLADPETLARAAADIERRYGVELEAEWPLASINVHCLVIDARGVPDIEGLIARMRADAAIRTVQRMQQFHMLAVQYADPLFPAQTALAAMNAPRAHLRSTGEGIRVGVVDSGVDASHPDLAPRLEDARDFVDATPKAVAEAHGTAIAGLIGADAHNGLGMVGVAPSVRLVGLRACWQTETGGRCSSFSLARALNFAIAQKIPVVNLSLGGPPDPLLTELIEAAIARGQVVVAAWGEDEAPTFPASVPGVIAAGGPVAEVGRGGAPRGLPAPEVDVLSASPGAGFAYFSGSSVAAAHVSGVAALLLSIRPDLTPAELARALDRAVSRRGGAPMLDACEALQAVDSQSDRCRG